MGTPFFVSTGILPKFSEFLTRVFIVVKYMVLLILRLPDGDITLYFARASTTSSGVRLKLRSLFGSMLNTMVRAFEPKGGGADRPGIVENIGRMRVAARSYMSFRFSVLLS